MAQHTQPLSSAQLHQTPASSTHSNNNLYQQNVALSVSSSSQNNNNNNSSNSLSNTHNNNSGPSNNNQQNSGTNHLGSNAVIVPVSQALYSTGAGTTASHQIHYPGPGGLYVAPTTGAVHAGHHTSLYPTLITAHMANSVYANNVAGNVNMPPTSAWTPVVPSYIPASPYNDGHGDTKNKYLIPNGFQLQQIPSIPIIQNTSVPPPQTMNMRGMRRRGRGGGARHNRDYHHNRNHHQHMQHHNQQSQQQHVITSEGAQVQDAGPQAIDATSGALIAGTTATSGPYGTHYAPPYQYAYPTYFAPQNAMIHTPHTATVPGQPGTAGGAPLYVPSLPIYNTPIYNYGYIYPSVPEYQFLPAGEEVPADGRQSADGGMMQPLWHPPGIYTDEYGVSTEIGAIPVNEDYNQNASLGSADAMSPNYAIYEPQQIPDLTHQIDAMQIYEDPQQTMEDPAVSNVIHSQHSLQTVPSSGSMSVASLIPQMEDNVAECEEGLTQPPLTVVPSNENIIISNQQTSEYIIEPRQEEIPVTHHRPINPRPALLPTPLGTELVPLHRVEQLRNQREAYLNNVDTTNDRHLSHRNDSHYIDYDVNVQSNHSIHNDGGNSISQVPQNIDNDDTNHYSIHRKISNSNINEVPKTMKINKQSDDVQINQQNQQQQQQHQHQHHKQSSASLKLADNEFDQSKENLGNNGMTGQQLTPRISSPPSPKQQRSFHHKQQQNNQSQQAHYQPQQQQHQHQHQQELQHQQQNDHRKSSNAGGVGMAVGGQQSHHQIQNQNQPPRRKHSSSDQTSVSSSSSDKYMQTTKTMSWTNSSQHKKSTASVAVTAVPLNQNHGRNNNKHSHSIRSSNPVTQPRSHASNTTKMTSTNSSMTTNPPVTGTIERKHSSGGGDASSLKNINKYKQVSPPNAHVSSSSGILVSGASNSSATNSSSGQGPLSQASKMSVGSGSSQTDVTLSTTSTILATSSTGISAVPNQFIQQQPPPQSIQTIQPQPEQLPSSPNSSSSSNPIKLNENASNAEQTPPTVVSSVNLVNLGTSSSSTSVSSSTTSSLSKQYSGFEQKKPVVPRTTSPSTTNNVATTNSVNLSQDSLSDNITTSSSGMISSSSITTSNKTTTTNHIPSSVSSLDSSSTSSGYTSIKNDSSNMNLAPPPPAVAAPVPASNATTSWASLFASSASAASKPANASFVNNRNASSLPQNVATPAATSSASATLKKQQSSHQQQQQQSQSHQNPTPPTSAGSKNLSADSKNANTNVNTYCVTPGPMSYSAASAQGLNNTNNNSTPSSASSAASNNKLLAAKSEPATITNSILPMKQSVTLDEWAAKYAEFLVKQKTDLSPISLRPRGLTNRSNYCYINSILQALLGCSPFFNLIRSIPKQMVALSNVKTPTINAMINFSSQFQTMPSGLRLRTNNRRTHKGNKDDIGAELQCDPAFEPTEIYKIWHDSRKEDVEGRQEDAEEFLGYVLNKINDEMEEVIKLSAKPKPEQNGQSEQSAEEDGDAWQMICNNRNRSSITRQNAYVNTPLSDIFRGELRSRLQREGEHSTDVIQPFFTLQLNIEKATSVKEALELLSGRDQLEGVTGSKSKQEVLAWQQMTIEKLPVVLILHLKYFDYRQDGLNKIIKQVEFPIELKIDPKIMATKKYSQRQRTYRLIAVVYHDGKEASKGHYIADVYHTGYSSWLRYDDNSVKPVSENHVLVPRSPRVPYLLYYRRCDTMPQTSSSSASNNSNNNSNSSHAGHQSNGNSSNNSAGDRSRH